MPIYLLLLLLGLVALLTSHLTGRVRLYALRRLLDVPNERSSHAIPTPRGGGLAIVVVFGLVMVSLFGLGLLPLPLFMALAGLVPLAVIGFIDDHGHVAARWRFLIQVAAAVWALLWIADAGTLQWAGRDYSISGVGYLIAGLLIVWTLNLFNFMDGIDGIAGTETLTISLSAALLMVWQAGGNVPAEALAALVLAAATVGFLVWNWPPARLFMGDVGSGVLGFVLSILALWSALQHTLSLTAWLILGGVFGVDATLTLIIRMMRGERWYEAHRSHAFQHAARHWASHRRVTRVVLAINVLALLPLAALASAQPGLEPALLALAFISLSVAAYRLGAGRP